MRLRPLLPFSLSLLLLALLAPTASAATGEQLLGGGGYVEKALNLTAGQSVTFSWQVANAGNPQAPPHPTADFNIHAHRATGVVTVHEAWGKTGTTGCVDATETAEYFLLWENPSGDTVKLTYTYTAGAGPCAKATPQQTPAPAFGAVVAAALSAALAARRVR